jgi:hypothetical protein
MKIPYRPLISFALAAALALPITISGCAARVDAGYRYHDRDHDDYHVWNNDEVVYYGQWENETRRDHKEFRKRDANDQKEYWNWRHNRDHDHDHDHDSDRH